MGSGASIASSLAPTGLAAAAIVCPPAALAAGAIFGVGVAVGAAWGASNPADGSPALDALDAVHSAAEAVMAYLRAAKDAACSAADWALEKLEQAAAVITDRVVRLLRRLRGRKEAAAVGREMGRRAARAQQQQHASPDVFAEAAARVARSRRCIMDATAASSAAAVVPYYAATPPGGASSAVLPGISVADSDVARRAARSAAEMMVLILEAFVAEADLGGSIPPAARSFITVIAAAAAVCLDIVVSPTAAATN